MSAPVAMTYRRMEPSHALEARTHEHIVRLQRFHDGILSCQVMIKAPVAFLKFGAFEVKAEVLLDGVREDRALCATRGVHPDAYVALRDAFDKIHQLLRQRDRSPRNEASLPGRRSTIGTIEALGERDGRIAAEDGRTVHFDRHTVCGVSFAELTVGVIVEFEEDEQLRAFAIRMWRTPERRSSGPNP